MKITNEEHFQHIEINRLSYFGINSDGKPICKHISLMLEFQVNGPPKPIVIPDSNGLSVEEWLTLVLENKLILPVENNTIETHETYKIFDLLFVREVNDYYICNTLFQILSNMELEATIVSIQTLH